MQNPKLTPLMEPLLPAFSRAVHHWGSQAQTLAVVHDEQSALTPERIADIATAFTADHRGHELTEVRFADSSREPAVQIADFVAGIARRLAATSSRAAQMSRSPPYWVLSLIMNQSGSIGEV